MVKILKDHKAMEIVPLFHIDCRFDQTDQNHQVDQI